MALEYKLDILWLFKILRIFGHSVDVGKERRQIPFHIETGAIGGWLERVVPDHPAVFE